MAKKRGENPKTPDPAKGVVGSKAIIKRNKKGDLEATYRSDFGGITQSTMKADRVRAKRPTDYGTVAPRVGGPQTPIAKSGPVVGGTKKMLRQSKRRVNKSSASKAAKRSAKKLY